MKIFGAVLAAALCLTVFSGCGPNAENTKPASDDKAFLTITDDTGRTVVLPEKPERVVSLATSYLNMIDAVGGNCRTCVVKNRRNAGSYEKCT